MTPDDPFKRGAIPDGDARITADDAETARLDDSVGVQGAASPDTGFGEGDISGTEQDIASDAVLADSGSVVQAPDDLSRDEMPRGDDDPSYRPAQEGRLVFKPGELNNAGEDKEYFHPKKDHHFDVPKDANNHALTPDMEVAPGNTVKTIK